MSGDRARDARFGDLAQQMRAHYGVDAPVPSPDRVPNFAEPARYRVLGVLARGGMGAILRVQDVRFDRMLAMKVARGDGGQRDAALVAEARTLARLQHPGLVPLHDADVDADGRAFFTMALVDGECLADLLASWRAAAAPDWSMPRVLDVLAKVCDAVAYAHDQGVVHRDLKPANVMLGRFGEVYVLDWGIAVSTAAADGPGAAVGTPAYMAPEQRGGGGAAVAGDVYSLGAMLHEMLTGSPDAGAGQAPGRAYAPLLAVCRRAMAPQPGDRYLTVAALAADVRAFLDGRVVRAWREGPVAELLAWHRRHRGIAATVAAAAVLVIALTTWFLVRLGGERDRAAAAASEARSHLAEVLDLAVSERVDDLRRHADALWPIAPARLAEMRAWRQDAEALRAVRDDLRARLAAAGSAPFADDFAWRWRHRLLARTVGDLDRFLDAAPATPFVGADVASMAEREAMLAWLARAAAEDAPLWDETARLLASEPRYAGVPMTPQFGLRPLGRDPRSGLLEFAHLLTGEPPARDADGRLVLEDRHALVLVLIPPGTFAMGATAEEDRDAEANESPVQTVALDAFFLAKHEMTQAQWRLLAGTNPSNHDARSLFVARGADGRHPVENITWSECRNLLARVGLDLPTEAQWEYAARAGSRGRFPGSDALTEAGGRAAANLADRTRKTALGAQCAAFEPELDDGHVMHAPVVCFAPNAFGLHDVAGNVWEWCRDEYVDYAAPPRRGDGARPCAVPPQLAMFRGGAFDCVAVEARCTNRAGAPPDVRQFTVGVRPARALVP